MRSCVIVYHVRQWECQGDSVVHIYQNDGQFAFQILPQGLREVLTHVTVNARKLVTWIISSGLSGCMLFAFWVVNVTDEERTKINEHKFNGSTKTAWRASLSTPSILGWVTLKR